MKIGIIQPEVRYTTTFPLFLAMETAKVDKSGFGYELLRKLLPICLNSNERMPKEAMEFIANEMTREHPFYPDSDKGASTDIMRRAVRIGFEITSAKREKPGLSIYNRIIPTIAKERGMTVANVKKDYEQRFLPVFDEAIKKATVAAEKYPTTPFPAKP